MSWPLNSHNCSEDMTITKIKTTANTRHRGFMARTLQLALPEVVEPFPRIKSHTLGTRSVAPQPLLGQPKPGIRGCLDSKFPSPRTPTHDRHGRALSCRYVRKFGPRLLIGYSQLTYTCAYTCTHTYIYMHSQIYIHTRAHTYIHIHRPSGCPPPADASQRMCQLPAQTIKLRILQQPGYQVQVVVNGSP